MELSHSFTVPAPIETTWAAFNDLESIAPCMPGATVEVTDESTFTGSIKVKLGPISLVYNGSGEYVERNESARRVVIEAKGKDKRGQGTAGATVRAVMEPDGDGTRVEVSTDLAITGKPAQFGRGVMQDVSDKLLGQFVDCISDRLTATGADQSADERAGDAAEGADAPGTQDEPEVAATAMPGRHAAEPAEGPDAPAAADESTRTAGTVGAPSPPYGGPASAGAASSGATASPGRVAAPAEVDLAGTVLPVVLRRYGPRIVAGLVAFVIVWRAVRRARR
ncbi:carbon monoxide dehydrogenase subunit G [Mumia flava]|uniref:Carbon monoxide dehydrogenase subunit G n=1 Tax=Mumia flava TaxID=1348852 RepID=A0A0B2BPS4_9ACTN|nr:SRPBCC family protein [Mumia flava]PJJ56997.1 carbon monoxide dehydrogenase subunit G [Mumia flava]